MGLKIFHKVALIGNCYGQLPSAFTFYTEYSFIIVAGDILSPTIKNNSIYSESWLKEEFYPWANEIYEHNPNCKIIVCPSNSYVSFIENMNKLFENKTLYEQKFNNISENIIFLKENDFSIDGIHFTSNLNDSSLDENDINIFVSGDTIEGQKIDLENTKFKFIIYNGSMVKEEFSVEGNFKTNIINYHIINYNKQSYYKLYIL